MMALNARQQRFVEEYLVDLNATAAAIRAGYSAKTAQEQGSRLLSNVMVQAAIQAARQAQSKRTEITQDYVLTRLRENLERAMQAEPVVDREGNATGEYTYQGSVANRACELLGKHLGMFADKHEITGKEGKPIAVKVEHNAGKSLEPFADAFAVFAQSVLDGGTVAAILPHGAGKSVGSSPSDDPASNLPPPR